MSDLQYDFVIVGSGPAGQKAAICAAKAGKRVLVVEREARNGGACVHHGTIPSKTLRETALALRSLDRRTGGVLAVEIQPDLEVASLMSRLSDVVRAHEQYIEAQLHRNHITTWHGHARLTSSRTLLVTAPTGERRNVQADTIVLATGSRPRAPEGVPIDHEHILDSDSILSMTYLPRSLIVLGSGVIGSEYASIFSSLGVNVTMIDASERPISFLDPDLTTAFLTAFRATGSRFLAKRRIQSVRHDGLAQCEVVLDDGEVIVADKVLSAQGRIANVDRLELAQIGIRTTQRGFIEVDAHCLTSVPNVYAVGDLIGPPALASAAMDQGRRAARHALGLPDEKDEGLTPFCAYTIPEIASVGLSDTDAIARHGGAIVGRAKYAEIARAHIAVSGDGLIKIVTDKRGRKILGVQVVGEGASELVHVGQMAMIAGADVEVFIDATFNFPTLAEGYRIAALDVVRQRDD